MSLSALLDEWKRGLESNHPLGTSSCRGGATPQAISDLAHATNLEIPDPLAALWGRWNGELRPLLLGNGFRLLSAQESLEFWRQGDQLLQLLHQEYDASEIADASEAADGQQCTDQDIKIRHDLWNRNWLPVAERNGDELICIDYDPTSEGCAGQVIQVWAEAEQWLCLGASFVEYLEARVADVV